MDEDGLKDFLAAFTQLSEAAGRLTMAGTGELRARVGEHLGTDPGPLPVVTEEVTPFRATDAALAVEHVVEAAGGGELLGVGGGDQRWHQGLADLLAGHWSNLPLGAVDYRTVSVGPDAERAIVAFGLYLLCWAGTPVVLLQRVDQPQYGAPARVEVLAAERDVAEAVLAAVRERMATHSILRGQVVTFGGSEFDPSVGRGNQAITFHPRPVVAAEQVILPDGVLERVNRHVLGVARQRAALVAAGQHLKRGVLLYGPPGTGKTHTVRHLIGRADGVTVILLTGLGLANVGLAADTARALQPAIVVLEDVDLVAEERGGYTSSPLLFQVLDALDGLASDADVVFLLTTNRAEVLEPALAQRPGRVDLSVQVPLPDHPARLALLSLYARDLPFSPEALEAAAGRTDGTTASFAKEAARRAVLLAAEAGHAPSDADLDAALTEMLEDADEINRTLLGAGDPFSPFGFDEED